MKKLLSFILSLLGMLLLLLIVSFLISLVTAYIEHKQDIKNNQMADRAFIHMYSIDKLPNVCHLQSGSTIQLLFKENIPYLRIDKGKPSPVYILRHNNFTDRDKSLTFIDYDRDNTLDMRYSDQSCTLIYYPKKHDLEIKDGYLNHIV